MADDVKPATDAEVAEWFQVDEWNVDNPESQIDWYCSAGERVNPNTVKSLLLRIRADGERIKELEGALKPFRVTEFFYGNDSDDKVISLGHWFTAVVGYPDQFSATLRICVGDLRRIWEALAGQEAGT